MIRPHYVPLFQSICLSKKVAKLPDDSCRFFYTLLLTHLDSHGRIEADAETLDAKVWPMLRKGEQETERVLRALAAVGLVKLYDAGAKRYLADAAWEEHAGSVGKPERRADSLFPAPPMPECSVDCRTTPALPGLVPPRARVGSVRIGSEKGVQGDLHNGAEDPVPECLDHWRREWGRTRAGTKATIREKDRTAVAWMVSIESTENVRRRMTAMLEDPEQFVVKNASLRLLESKWDAYAVAASKGESVRERIEEASTRARERDVERRWNAKHATMIEVPGPGGTKIRAPGVDSKYPGFEAARRELEGAA